ncbi:MAG: hypothetical protein M5U19_17185 [Microthrixaceae bacterium]|nr:hypothetical protein [Microthrixaceae bacterium]
MPAVSVTGTPMSAPGPGRSEQHPPAAVSPGPWGWGGVVECGGEERVDLTCSVGVDDQVHLGDHARRGVVSPGCGTAADELDQGLGTDLGSGWHLELRAASAIVAHAAPHAVRFGFEELFEGNPSGPHRVASMTSSSALRRIDTFDFASVGVVTAVGIGVTGEIVDQRGEP